MANLLPYLGISSDIFLLSRNNRREFCLTWAKASFKTSTCCVILHAKPSSDEKLNWTYCMEHIERRSKTWLFIRIPNWEALWSLEDSILFPESFGLRRVGNFSLVFPFYQRSHYVKYIRNMFLCKSQSWNWNTTDASYWQDENLSFLGSVQYILQVLDILTIYVCRLWGKMCVCFH